MYFLLQIVVAVDIDCLGIKTLIKYVVKVNLCVKRQEAGVKHLKPPLKSIYFFYLSKQYLNIHLLL